MGTGYVRQSAADIVTGNVVEAGPINAEFNQIRDAFHESSGHAHDGTTGEGPKISLTTSISGLLQLANGGIAGIHKTNATTAPIATDDNTQGYVPGSTWIDTTNDKSYVCVDATTNTAVWRQTGGSGAWQPLDSDLTAIAALTSAANKLLYATGPATWALADFTAAGRALLDDADNVAQLVTLGLTATATEINVLDGITASTTELNYVDGVTSAIQTQLNNKQPLDDDLTALSALSGTGVIYYRSGAGAWTQVTIDPSLSFSGGTLAVVAAGLDPELTALASVTSAANKLPYFTGSGTADVTDFTAFARTLLDDANNTTARATLGVSIGTDVQAYDSDLATIAGLSPVDDDVLQRKGGNWINRTIAQLWADLQSTVNTYFKGLGSVSVASGDILYGSGTNVLSNLAKGADGTVLSLVSGLPAWAAITGGVSNVSAQYFTSNATYTPTAGTKYAIVFVTGGGGGVVTVTADSSRPGAGGGGTAVGILSAADIGASKAIVIGAGGTSSGGAGGNSTFGSTMLVGNGGAGDSTSAGGSASGTSMLLALPGMSGGATISPDAYSVLRGSGGGSVFSPGIPTRLGAGASLAGVGRGGGAGGNRHSAAGAVGSAGCVLVIEFA